MSSVIEHFLGQHIQIFYKDLCTNKTFVFFWHDFVFLSKVDMIITKKMLLEKIIFNIIHLLFFMSNWVDSKYLIMVGTIKETTEQEKTSLWSRLRSYPVFFCLFIHYQCMYFAPKIFFSSFLGCVCVRVYMLIKKKELLDYIFEWLIIIT